MPLPKRVIEPIHISRGTVPDANQCSLQNELEAVTNGTLANAIRQLSSLSRHAEDLFGELARDAHILAFRANSLQARLDKLAIKTTQLDSTVEEVSLQEIHMRKAFKSAIVFDQQVVSRDTMPTAMLETYNQCDKPPPLYNLNPYREDGKDGMKFYTDPDYFFQLWRQEMLKDTERMMLDRGRKPHKPRSADSSGGRHKKRVRQPHSTRERQKQIAVGHGEYIMPNSESPYAVPPRQEQVEYEEDNYMTSPIERPSRPNSIELKRNLSQRIVDNGGIIYSPTANRHSPVDVYYRNTYDSSSLYSSDSHYRQFQPTVNNHQLYQQQSQQQPQQPIMSPVSCHSIMSPVNDVLSPNGTPTRGSRANSQRPSQPPPAPPSTTNSSSSTPSACNTPTRGRSMSTGRDTLPPPPPPPVEMQYTSTSPPPELPPPPSSVSASPPPPPCNIPPPPPPPPPLPYAGTPNESPTQIVANGDIGKSPMKSHIISVISPNKMSPPKQTPPSELNSSSSSIRSNKPAICVPNGPLYDPRSDLLKAIRDGIKLRKVEKIEQKEGERVKTLHDVASILARRVAVEFSDSESGSDSECDSDDWAEPETTSAIP